MRVRIRLPDASDRWEGANDVADIPDSEDADPGCGRGPFPRPQDDCARGQEVVHQAVSSPGSGGLRAMPGVGWTCMGTTIPLGKGEELSPADSWKAVRDARKALSDDDSCPSTKSPVHGAFAGSRGTPLLHRHQESGLAALEDFVGKRRTERARHVGLANRQARDQHGQHRAEESHVDVRHADLERMCHAGPVAVAQQLIAHVPVELERGNDGAVALEALNVALEVMKGLKVA